LRRVQVKPDDVPVFFLKLQIVGQFEGAYPVRGNAVQPKAAEPSICSARCGRPSPSHSRLRHERRGWEPRSTPCRRPSARRSTCVPGPPHRQGQQTPLDSNVRAIYSPKACSC
jgi:hypothetical protein